MKVDIGGTKPVEGDRISEIYSASKTITLYNPKSGKTTERNLRGIEPWELVELLGGAELFATWVFPEGYQGARVWIRRSYVRGIVTGAPDPSDPKGLPRSLVQMVYHRQIPEPWPWKAPGWPDCVFYSPYPPDETQAMLDVRAPIDPSDFEVEPPREPPTTQVLTEALEGDSGLRELGTQILRTARPQVHLKAASTDEPAGYLLNPKGQHSPIMLAAIDLASVGQEIGLPAKGSLAFYHDSGSRTWGDKPAHCKKFAVRHQPESAHDLVAGLANRAVTLTPSVGVGLPPIGSTDEESIRLSSDTQEEAYTDLLYVLYGEPGSCTGVPGTWLGGHPYQLQDDMQEQSAEMARKAWGVESDPTEWRLLLQLASESEANMRWGDEGFLYYWIRESDLAAGRFEHVWCILQTM